MESSHSSARRAEDLASDARRLSSRSDPENERLEHYYLCAAQIHATLAVAAALHELRTMLARDNDPDAGAFVRVAGRITTETDL